jgi:hypothetical protein
VIKRLLIVAVLASAAMPVIAQEALAAKLTREDLNKSIVIVDNLT